MHNYDIALINVLHLPQEFTRKLYEPVGLHILASFLESNGFSATVMTGTVTESISFLNAITASCIGMTCNYDNIFAVKRLAKHVRQTLNIPVIFGGPQAVAIDESFMHETDALATVVGEGELPLLELMQLIVDKVGNLATIAGILYINEHNTLTKNLPRKPIKNLDALPFPSISHCFYKKFRTQNTVTIFTGRGCPFSCAFCYEGALTEKRVRNRSVNNVMSEIDAVFADNPHVRYICFVDDTFTLDARRIKEFCYHLTEKRKQHDFVWFCESRVDFILKHPDLIEMMKLAGLVAIQIGIESGELMVLQAYNKKITPEQIEQAVAICYEKKIPSVYANYIIGGAFESKQTIENSFSPAKSFIAMAPGIVGLTTPFFAPSPENPMNQNPEKFGIRLLE
ncbi:hypothetical protein TI05_05905, partial [Achromatium sp. WMS3]